MNRTDRAYVAIIGILIACMAAVIGDGIWRDWGPGYLIGIITYMILLGKFQFVRRLSFITLVAGFCVGIAGVIGTIIYWEFIC